MGTEMAAKRTS